jgi:hypothetical protein
MCQCYAIVATLENRPFFNELYLDTSEAAIEDNTSNNPLGRACFNALLTVIVGDEVAQGSFASGAPSWYLECITL